MSEPRIVRFSVSGKPEPKGSTRIVPLRGRQGARPIITSDNPMLKSWQYAVRISARALGAQLFTGPVDVWLVFRLARPKSLPLRFAHPVRKPDVDKLTRAVLDAITGVLLRDDAQVVELHARKVFDATPGVDVAVAAVVPCGALPL